VPRHIDQILARDEFLRDVELAADVPCADGAGDRVVAKTESYVHPTPKLELEDVRVGPLEGDALLDYADVTMGAFAGKRQQDVNRPTAITEAASEDVLTEG
jgi:hypothetical protein